MAAWVPSLISDRKKVSVFASRKENGHPFDLDSNTNVFL